MISSKDVDINNKKQFEIIKKEYEKQNRIENWWIVLDVDQIKKLFSDFNWKNSSEVHESASKILKKLFEEEINNSSLDTVIFTAWWWASWKSDILIPILQEWKPAIIFDGTQRNFERLIKNYEELILKWKKVQVEWVIIDFPNAVQYNNTRWRVEPIEVLKNSHKWARETMLKLAKDRPDIPFNLKYNAWIDENWNALIYEVPKEDIINFIELMTDL